jgi:hypothetical protein
MESRSERREASSNADDLSLRNDRFSCCIAPSTLCDEPGAPAPPRPSLPRPSPPRPSAPRPAPPPRPSAPAWTAASSSARSSKPSLFVSARAIRRSASGGGSSSFERRPSPFASFCISRSMACAGSTGGRGRSPGVPSPRPRGGSVGGNVPSWRARAVVVEAIERTVAVRKDANFMVISLLLVQSGRNQTRLTRRDCTTCKACPKFTTGARDAPRKRVLRAHGSFNAQAEPHTRRRQNDSDPRAGWHEGRSELS